MHNHELTHITHHDAFDTANHAAREGFSASSNTITGHRLDNRFVCRCYKTYIACLGRLRLWFILRFNWYSESNVVADKPLPTLLVNFVKLSEKPKTVFLTKLAAPWECVSEANSRCQPTWPYLCDTNPDIFVAMHDHSVERLIEDIRDSGADIGEETNRVSNEVCRTEDPV